MRILMLSSYFYPHYGGSQHYMEELYVNLIKLDPSLKIDVICYNTNGVSKHEKYRGLNLYRVPCIQILPGQFALPNYFSLIKLITQLTSKYHYDIVHSNTRFFEHSWWAPFLAKIIGAKSILTDHCAAFPAHRSKAVSFMAMIIDRISAKMFMRFYDLTTVTNLATLKFAKSIGLKEPKLIYGGVDTNLFKPGRANQSRIIPVIKRKINNNEIIISFVGRMIQTKGPQLLLEAAKEIVSKYPRVRFIFAGSGEYANKLSMQTGSRVYFLGSLSRTEVSKLLAITDIFVHPSSHHEGFPNSILEAGASGCAVIATNKGGTNELIQDNITGIIIQPNVKSLEQALIKLIEDKKLRNNLGKDLRQKIVKEFDWQIITKQFHKKLQTIQVLDKVVSMRYYRTYQ